MKVHYSSKSSDWETPSDVFSTLNSEFNFTLDPCCTHENKKCPRYYTKEADGLAQDWGQERVFMNPPYGRGVIDKWMRKAYESAQLGATVVCLIPARTDTQWWHSYAAKGEVRFRKGRIKFVGAESGAPFPSAIVVLKKL